MSIFEKIGFDTKAFKLWNAKRKFNGKMRARVYRKLGSFIENGVPLPEALKIMWEHSTDDGRNPNDPVGVVMQAWLKEVNNGRSLGRAINGWVSNSDRIVIDAGEHSGSLSGALNNALFISDSTKKIRSAIIAGLAYPAVLLTLAIGLVLMFGIKIIPSYESIKPKSEWEGGAQLLVIMSDISNIWLIPIMCVFGVVVACMMYSLPRWVGKTRARFDRFPPWSLYRLVNGSGFMLSVSALVKAGVQVPEILRILRKEATPWYDERIGGALRHVSNGVNLGEALYRTKLGFPDTDTVMDLRSYAQMDGFDEKLELLGRQWVESSVDRVKAQMAVFKNLAIIMLGVIFAIIAVGSTSLNQQLMNSSK